MNQKPLLLASLGVNLGLLVLVTIMATNRPSSTSSNAIRNASGAPSARPERPTPDVGQGPVGAGGETALDRFRWAVLESTDYSEYIANLRSVGCPGETIADIIRADVEKLYQEALDQTSPTPDDFEYWRPKATPLPQPVIPVAPASRREKEGLIAEREELLRTLLGPDYQPPSRESLLHALSQDVVDSYKDSLSFLPESKVTQLLDLRAEYQILTAERVQELGVDPTDPLYQRTYREVGAELNASIAELLTPEEKVEYDLRFSPVAMGLRFTLSGFNPSEQEFRDLFALEQSRLVGVSAYFGVGASYGYSTEAIDLAAVAAAEEQYQAQVQQTLGTDRYDEYLRSQDPDYADLERWENNFQLAEGAAENAYDIKRVAELEIQRLQAESGLEGIELQAALDAIQEDTASAVQQVLGEEAYQSYRQTPASDWLNGLAPAIDIEPTAPPLGISFP